MPKTSKTSHTPSLRKRDTHIPSAQKEMWRYKFGELINRYGMIPGFQRVMEQRRESRVVGVKKIGTMKLCMKMLLHVGIYRGMLRAHICDASLSTSCSPSTASREGEIISFYIKQDCATDFMRFLLENIMEYKVDWNAFRLDDKQIGLDMEERRAHSHVKTSLKGVVQYSEVAACANVEEYSLQGVVQHSDVEEYANVEAYPEIWTYDGDLWKECGDVFEHSENIELVASEEMMSDSPTKVKYAGGFQGTNWKTLCNTIRAIGFVPDTSAGYRKHTWRDAFKGRVPFCLIQPKGSLVELEHYYI
jgi:hypothetical protein